MLDDVPRCVSNRSLKHYSLNLHTGEIDAHKLSRFEYGCHLKLYSRAASGACPGGLPFQIAAVDAVRLAYRGLSYDKLDTRNYNAVTPHDAFRETQVLPHDRTNAESKA